LNYALGAKAGFEWKWIGLEAGYAYNTYTKGDAKEVVAKLLSEHQPIAGLRIGDEDLLYASAEWMGASPLVSGGGILSAGVGGKLDGTRLWGGVGAVPQEQFQCVLKADRAFGPVSLYLSGQLNPARMERIAKFGDYGFSLGFAYRLPWNR
jgi:hypothetical protein